MAKSANSARRSWIDRHPFCTAWFSGLGAITQGFQASQHGSTEYCHGVISWPCSGLRPACHRIKTLNKATSVTPSLRYSAIRIRAMFVSSCVLAAAVTLGGPERVEQVLDIVGGTLFRMWCEIGDDREGTLTLTVLPSMTIQILRIL